MFESIRMDRSIVLHGCLKEMILSFLIQGKLKVFFLGYSAVRGYYWANIFSFITHRYESQSLGYSCVLTHTTLPVLVFS